MASRTAADMASEMDNEDVQVDGVMAEQIVGQAEPEETQEAAQAAPAATPPVSAPAPQPAATTPPAQPPAASYLESLDENDGDDEGDGKEAGQPAEPTRTPHVPAGMIHDIQRERQRRKEAEAQAAEYQRRLAEAQATRQAATEQADTDLQSLLEGDDDDFIEKGKLLKVLPKVIEASVSKATASVRQELSQREQAAQTQAARAQRKAAMAESETRIRQTVKDYDAVVSEAMKLNVLTAEDRKAILTSPNPAGTLYFKSKQVLSAFGIQPQVVAPAAPSPQAPKDSQTPTPPAADEIANDEDFMASIGFKRLGG